MEIHQEASPPPLRFPPKGVIGSRLFCPDTLYLDITCDINQCFISKKVKAENKGTEKSVMLAFNLMLNKAQLNKAQGEFVRRETKKTNFTTCPRMKLQGQFFKSGGEKLTEKLLLITSKAITTHM